MPKLTKVGKHIVIRKEDPFTIIDDLEKDSSTLLSPRTWRKLCTSVEFISKKIKSKDRSWKFIRKLSYSMTFEVVASSPQKIVAKLKTHNDPCGIKLNTVAWYHLVKVCKKCKAKQVLRERVVYPERSPKKKNSQVLQVKADPLEELTQISAKFDDLHL